ncbi:hypothetical protein IQ268_26365 [Oculatella sp. LEGE 06141]|uniref:hypothetical protein n=1 Tax=Oculatella sp. LEGE 06141 TaxID=1828648 RepID=UPI001882B53D|nr:hypothetical protein [Oculatella sp. LEGE 06141]MBE9182095.1 hypothetical protein [Oculatella sp. LEGE 06141]
MLAVITEDCIHQFCFIARGSLHTGMTTRDGLYKLHRSFRKHRRSHALAVASALSYQGIGTVVTVSAQQNHYRVWTDFRTGRTQDATSHSIRHSSDRQ